MSRDYIIDDIDDLKFQIRQWQHDFKSPLSTLGVITERLKKQGAKEADILEATFQRLKSFFCDVSLDNQKNLQGLDKDKDKNKEFTHLPLALALKNLFLQKQTEYASRAEVQFSFNCLLPSTVRIPIISSDLQRIVSNLINNSFEAIKGSGWVRVSLWQEEPWIVIQVVDSGSGIPKHLYKQVIECGFSHGKSAGSGLGLWQAHQLVDQAGGEMKIHSKIQDKTFQGGTSIQIKLPYLTK